MTASQPSRAAVAHTPWVAGTVLVNGVVPADEAIVYVGGDADVGPEVEIVIRGPDALRISGLVAAAPDMLEALVMALPYVEGLLDDQGYKPNAVKLRVKLMREAIAKAVQS